jgi:hypothetical protein
MSWAAALLISRFKNGASNSILLTLSSNWLMFTLAF